MIFPVFIKSEKSYLITRSLNAISSFFTFIGPEACIFVKKETLARVFSCRLCKIFNSTFFCRTPLVASSSYYKRFETFSKTRTLSATAQKMKFSIKDYFSKCDQIRSFLRIWSHLLKKSLMENFTFCAVCSANEGYLFGIKIIRLSMTICF